MTHNGSGGFGVHGGVASLDDVAVAVAEHGPGTIETELFQEHNSKKYAATSTKCHTQHTRQNKHKHMQQSAAAAELCQRTTRSRRRRGLSLSTRGGLSRMRRTPISVKLPGPITLAQRSGPDF